MLWVIIPTNDLYIELSVILFGSSTIKLFPTKQTGRFSEYIAIICLEYGAVFAV